MKTYLNILLLLISTLGLKAQKSELVASSEKRPKWINDKAFSKRNGYFRVVDKFGISKEAALQAALDDAVTQIALSEGCILNSGKIKVTIRKENDGKLSIMNLTDTSTFMQICSEISTQSFKIEDGPYYRETEKNGKTDYYCSILVYFFKPKPVCNKKAIMWSIFPGGGQIYKKEYGRSALIWGGLVGTGALSWTFYDNYKYYHENIPDVSEHDKRKDFMRFERNNKIGFVSSGAAALGLYIWNLYDARHHENNRTRQVCMLPVKIKIEPYLASSHQGVSIYILFP